MKEEYLYKLCNIIGGKPNPQFDSAFSESESISFVKMKDLGKYHLTTNLLETEKKIKIEYAEKNGYKLIKKGSVILPRSGSVSQNHRAILGIDAYIVSHIFALEIIDENVINNYYLYYYLLNIDLGLIANKTTGIDSITKERLGLLRIPIPPIEIQDKIISILKVIQKAEEKRKKSINLLNEFLRSIFFELFGDPIANTKQWKIKKKLSEIGEWKTGGTPTTSNLEYYNGNIPWFTSGELGKVFIDKSNKSISLEAIKNSNAKIIPQHSIMIGMYDTAAFKMSMNLVECCCNQAILYSKLNEDVYTLYVYYSLNYSKEFHLNKRKGARQKNLNATLIKEIEIFFPHDKNKIEHYNLLHALIEKQKQKINDSRNVLDNLFKSYLELLFVGKTNNVETSLEALNNENELLELINLFRNNKFVNQTDYNIKKDHLFELLEKSENELNGITQIFNNDIVELHIK